MIYDSLEQNLGIIAACIPAIKPLFRSKRSAKNSARQVEDQRPLHRDLNESAPSPPLAHTAHDSAGTYQTEIERGLSIQRDEISLESLDGKGDNVEIGLPKTAHISHESTPDSVPGMWSAVSHPQDDGTKLRLSLSMHGF